MKQLCMHFIKILNSWTVTNTDLHYFTVYRSVGGVLVTLPGRSDLVLELRLSNYSEAWGLKHDLFLFIRADRTIKCGDISGDFGLKLLSHSSNLERVWVFQRQKPQNNLEMKTWLPKTHFRVLIKTQRKSVNHDSCAKCCIHLGQNLSII